MSEQRLLDIYLWSHNINQLVSISHVQSTQNPSKIQHQPIPFQQARSAVKSPVHLLVLYHLPRPGQVVCCIKAQFPNSQLCALAASHNLSALIRHRQKGPQRDVRAKRRSERLLKKGTGKTKYPLVNIQKAMENGHL